VTNRTYVLTPIIYRIFKSKGKVIVCRYCGKPIKPGEKVLAKRSGRKMRHYHPKCYEATLHG